MAIKAIDGYVFLRVDEIQIDGGIVAIGGENSVKKGVVTHAAKFPVGAVIYYKPHPKNQRLGDELVIHVNDVVGVEE